MKKILFLLVSFFIFISCSQEVNIDINRGYQSPNNPTYVEPGNKNANGEYAITIGDYSNGTRAHAIGNDYEQLYNRFKLYCWSNSSIVMNPFAVEANSEGKWCYVGVNNQDTCYYSKYTDWHNFIGVIAKDNGNDAVEIEPLNSVNDDATIKVKGIESFKSKNINGKTSEVTEKEFLYAQNKVEKSNYNQSSVLNFVHGNAKLMFRFKSDKSDTELLDFTPSQEAIPATPAGETYTKKTVKFIDELVAGHEVQVAIGFYGANSPKLTENNPNPLYVGTNNTTNGWLSKDWLLSIKDAVNSQFVYYRLNSVANSTSKTETTEDWESAASNKNIFMMKLADGVDKAAFAAGNDAFMNALNAHETDWVGGSPAMPFKQMFAQAYAAGWRVIRINVSDTNPSQVLVFLSSNIEASTQVCEITPGNPGQDAIVGIKGFIVLPAISATGDASDAIRDKFTDKSDITLGINSVEWSNQEYVDSIHFDLPNNTTLNTSNAIYSPTVYYTLPYKVDNYGMTIKISYKYNGVNYYDNRVYISKDKLPNGLEAGKYYIFTINITGYNGEIDPKEADENDPVIDSNNGIHIEVNIVDYESGYEGSDINIGN